MRLALVLLLLSTTPVYADSHGKFPGKGSVDAYNQSCDVADKAKECWKAKDYAGAAQSYKQAIAIYPYDSATCFNLGRSFQKLGKWDEAKESFKKAIDLEPDYGAVWLSLGRIFEHQHDFTQAEKAYRRASELEPHDYSSVGSLGDILRQQGKFEEAKKWLLRAKALPESEKYPGEIDKALSQCEKHDYRSLEASGTK